MENNIVLDDSLSVDKLRKLHELHNALDKALNEEEFVAIILIYDKCIERLLNKNNKS